MNRSLRGVTLIEMLIVVSLIGIAGVISKVGIDIVNGFAKQKERLVTQRKAQDAMHNIARDIRNAKSIYEISQNKLVLQMFDTKLGYDIKYNVNLFSSVVYGTVTYELKGTGLNTYLERKAVYPSVGTSKISFAQNILETSTTSIFSVFTYDVLKGTSPPFDGCDVRLPLASKLKGAGEREYRGQILKRGSLE